MNWRRRVWNDTKTPVYGFVIRTRIILLSRTWRLYPACLYQRVLWHHSGRWWLWMGDCLILGIKLCKDAKYKCQRGEEIRRSVLLRTRAFFWASSRWESLSISRSFSAFNCLAISISVMAITVSLPKDQRIVPFSGTLLLRLRRRGCFGGAIQSVT